MLQPLQHLGHEASLGHESPASAGAGSPLLALGTHTKRCRSTSSCTVEGDLPSPLAIALQLSFLSSPLSMESLSAFVSLA